MEFSFQFSFKNTSSGPDGPFKEEVYQENWKKKNSIIKKKEKEGKCDQQTIIINQWP